MIRLFPSFADSAVREATRGHSLVPHPQGL